jgi:hypothetical protein
MKLVPFLLAIWVAAAAAGFLYGSAGGPAETALSR